MRDITPMLLTIPIDMHVVLMRIPGQMLIDVGLYTDNLRECLSRDSFQLLHNSYNVNWA